MKDVVGEGDATCVPHIKDASGVSLSPTQTQRTIATKVYAVAMEIAIEMLIRYPNNPIVV